MKISDVFEMTMRAGSFENKLNQHVPSLEDATSGEHCGDIEAFKVFKAINKNDRVVYTLVSVDEVVGYFNVVPRGEEVEIEIAYVIKKLQRSGIFSMFLFFLKRSEGFSKIIIGDIHSQDTVDAVKRISKRFTTSWARGNEIKPYDETTIDDFYSISRTTGWKIVLENNGDFTSWPKFYDPAIVDLKQFYTGFID